MSDSTECPHGVFPKGLLWAVGGEAVRTPERQTPPPTRTHTLLVLVGVLGYK